MSTNERSVSLLICEEIFFWSISKDEHETQSTGKKDDQCTRTDTGSPQPVFD